MSVNGTTYKGKTTRGNSVEGSSRSFIYDPSSLQGFLSRRPLTVPSSSDCKNLLSLQKTSQIEKDHHHEQQLHVSIRSSLHENNNSHQEDENDSLEPSSFQQPRRKSLRNLERLTQSAVDLASEQGPLNPSCDSTEDNAHPPPQTNPSTPFNSDYRFAKRQQVKNACVNCQQACKKCNNARPCERCIKYNITETCRDSVRKVRAKGSKRGPYIIKRKFDDINSHGYFCEVHRHLAKHGVTDLCDESLLFAHPQMMCYRALTEVNGSPFFYVPVKTTGVSNNTVANLLSKQQQIPYFQNLEKRNLLPPTKPLTPVSLLHHEYHPTQSNQSASQIFDHRPPSSSSSSSYELSPFQDSRLHPLAFSTGSLPTLQNFSPVPNFYYMKTSASCPTVPGENEPFKILQSSPIDGYPPSIHHASLSAPTRGRNKTKPPNNRGLVSNMNNENMIPCTSFRNPSSVQHPSPLSDKVKNAPNNQHPPPLPNQGLAYPMVPSQLCELYTFPSPNPQLKAQNITMPSSETTQDTNVPGLNALSEVCFIAGASPTLSSNTNEKHT